MARIALGGMPPKQPRSLRTPNPLLTHLGRISHCVAPHWMTSVPVSSRHSRRDCTTWSIGAHPSSPGSVKIDILQTARSPILARSGTSTIGGSPEFLKRSVTQLGPSGASSKYRTRINPYDSHWVAANTTTRPWLPARPSAVKARTMSTASLQRLDSQSNSPSGPTTRAPLAKTPGPRPGRSARIALLQGPGIRSVAKHT
mmetsp:Transcript_36906/g.98318  ORF Transcript_36906/g.98318 Transcript_36906/m.98318 type:complete len:200 (+) Transcript_36906:834-1433(+)